MLSPVWVVCVKINKKNQETKKPSALPSIKKNFWVLMIMEKGEEKLEGLKMEEMRRGGERGEERGGGDGDR